MEEMSWIPHPETSEEIIRPHLTISDENQNKLKKAEAMDTTVKHDSKNRNAQENALKSCTLDHDSVSGIVPPGPSPALLASLQSLVEDNDHMLLPHSLHQIAETYLLEEDYQWAVEFISLEKLYHERLLSNLASIQEQWESQWKTSVQTKSNSPVSESEKAHMDSLSQICRTHQRPSLHAEQNTNDTELQSSPTHVKEHRGTEHETDLVNSTAKENRAGDCSRREAEQEPDEDCELNEEGLEEDLEEDEYWNEELQEETDNDGQVPADELAKLIQIEETFPSNGLVSILKKRVCVKEIDHLNPQKNSTKRKVRFREPDDPFEQDESTRKSCLILLLLCLVTVVISMGWTALYCLVGETYSTACVDFSHNMDFYFGPVRRGVDSLTQWLSS